MKQLAPAGQLVPVNDQLFYQAPTGERVQIQDDRAAQLAQLLPLAYAGKLATAQAKALQHQHDELLRQSAESFQSLAIKTIDNQQKTIDSLAGTLRTLAEHSAYEPIVEVHRFQMGDAAEKLAVAGVLTVMMALTALSVNLIARNVVANSQPQSSSAQYINR